MDLDQTTPAKSAGCGLVRYTAGSRLSWNDYYRFRYSTVRSRGLPSKLPGLADSFAFLGIPFAIVVVFGSGIRSPWSEINGSSILAISMVVGFWFLATIGEDFPRAGCWILLVLSCAILAAIAWLAFSTDWTRISNSPRWLLIAFAAYDSVAGLGAAYHLFIRAGPDAAAIQPLDPTDSSTS